MPLRHRQKPTRGISSQHRDWETLRWFETEWFIYFTMTSGALLCNVYETDLLWKFASWTLQTLYSTEIHIEPRREMLPQLQSKLLTSKSAAKVGTIATLKSFGSPACADWANFQNWLSWYWGPIRDDTMGKALNYLYFYIETSWCAC